MKNTKPRKVGVSALARFIAQAGALIVAALFVSLLLGMVANKLYFSGGSIPDLTLLVFLLPGVVFALPKLGKPKWMLAGWATFAVCLYFVWPPFVATYTTLSTFVLLLWAVSTPGRPYFDWRGPWKKTTEAVADDE